MALHLAIFWQIASAETPGSSSFLPRGFVLPAPYPCIHRANLCEPFAGTGTFVARLLQLGVIPPEALEYKYKTEIFANEFVLLSYYIASINIE